MAISDELPGVRITITANDSALHEHTDPHATETEVERTVTRYIEVVSGQVFEIFIEVLPGFEYKGNGISFQTWLDAAWIEAPVIEKSISQKHVCDDAILPSGKVKRFKFVTFDTDSNTLTHSNDASRTEHLGTIKIICFHERILHRTRLKKGPAVKAVGKVNEEAVKGREVSHKIEYSKAEKSKYAKPSKEIVVDQVAGEPYPAATFVFHYRSLAALKALGVIPRTPSPPRAVPLERLDPNTMTVEQIAELQKQKIAADERNDAKPYIKNEPTDENPRPRKRSCPNVGITVLEIDDDGNFHESTVQSDATGGVVDLD